ncbi:hypothetical protein D3C86_1730490 [compost metagenome]
MDALGRAGGGAHVARHAANRTILALGEAVLAAVARGELLLLLGVLHDGQLARLEEARDQVLERDAQALDDSQEVDLLLDVRTRTLDLDRH